MGKRPGFKVPKSIFKLVFEDEQFEGLEVRVRSLSLSEFFRLQQLQGDAGGDIEAARGIIERLADAIVTWNLEDEDGEAVKPTADNLQELEIGFVMAIISAWMEAIATVPNRSPGGSNAGETSQELSIPMDVL